MKKGQFLHWTTIIIALVIWIIILAILNIQLKGKTNTNNNDLSVNFDNYIAQQETNQLLKTKIQYLGKNITFAKGVAIRLYDKNIEDVLITKANEFFSSRDTSTSFGPDCKNLVCEYEIVVTDAQTNGRNMAYIGLAQNNLGSQPTTLNTVEIIGMSGEIIEFSLRRLR